MFLLIKKKTRLVVDSILEDQKEKKKYFFCFNFHKTSSKSDPKNRATRSAVDKFLERKVK
jgi:hypothetical protein